MIVRSDLCRLIMAAATIFTSTVSIASAQTTDAARAARSRIIGVFDGRSGEPLAGVQVRDIFTGTATTTTATGTASLGFVTFHGEAGLIDLRKIGYEVSRVVVSRNDTALTEIMEPIVELEPVVSNERYRIDLDPGTWSTFEQRCQSKSVTCIRDHELEQRQTSSMATVLVRIDGITIGSCQSASVTGRGSAQPPDWCGKIVMKPAVIPPRFCVPTFFVDGSVWDSHMGPPIDLVPGSAPNGVYTPANVKAVEVYPSERARPMRFQGGDPTCGVVAIWSK
jgi:hypothetical protein